MLFVVFGVLEVDDILFYPGLACSVNVPGFAEFAMSNSFAWGYFQGLLSGSVVPQAHIC